VISRNILNDVESLPLLEDPGEDDPMSPESLSLPREARHADADGPEQTREQRNGSDADAALSVSLADADKPEQTQTHDWTREQRNDVDGPEQTQTREQRNGADADEPEQTREQRNGLDADADAALSVRAVTNADAAKPPHADEM